MLNTIALHQSLLVKNMILESTNQMVWLDGQFIPWDEANLSIAAHHYAIGVFEGLRAYPTNQGTAIFRLQDHTDRLFRSAHILNIPIAFSKTELNCAQQEILQKNNLSSAYIRPFVFYDGITGLSLHIHKLTPHVIIMALPWQEKGAYLNTEHANTGVKVCTSSLTRNHVNSIFCKAKANGNYMNSILALQEAKMRGADEALLLDHQGFVAEGSSANIFIVRNNILYTPEPTSALEGITRQTIFDLAADLNLVVKERLITRDEIYIADEAFFTGTAVEVTSIRELDGREINSGEKGPITKQFQDLYQKITHGECLQYHHWLTFPKFNSK